MISQRSARTPSHRQCFCHGTQSPPRSNSTRSRAGDNSSLCPTCVFMAIQNLQQLHEAALEKRNVARENCVLPQNRLSELGYESARLREKLSQLRHECASLAVTVASQVVENDERQAQLKSTEPKRKFLHRLEQALYQPGGVGALTQAIMSATATVKRLRFHWCLQVFAMFRLDVAQVEPQRPHERQKHARGVGKIGGLPLPHAGVELYGVLPPTELQSALRLVAGLTCTLAQCLGILLPHPILLQPSSSSSALQVDIIDQHSKDEQHSATVAEDLPKTSNPSTPSTADSILDFMNTTTWGRSAKTALQRATGVTSTSSRNSKSSIPAPLATLKDGSQAPSMDSTAVSQRLLHAAAAVLAEDTSATAASFALLPSSPGDAFGIGLQLLQNDVIALCIRVGVPVHDLWPAGAVLLNLKALMAYCAHQVLQCDDE